MANETKRLPITRRSLLLLPLFFLSSCAHTQEEGFSFPKLLQQIITTVEEHHLQPRVIDDELSEVLYDNFLVRIDPDSTLLSDLARHKLAGFRLHIDDDLTAGKLHFLDAVAEQLPAEYSHDELLYTFIDAYLSINDYQSDFMTPAEKVQWDAAFNRSLVGAGIRYELRDDYPEITKIYINGPAWNSQRIQPGDHLLGISTADGEKVDFNGKSTEEINTYLLGEEGSALQLHIRHGDGSFEQVDLIRARFALSRSTTAVLNASHDATRIGYIRLPRYYSGEYSAAADVLSDLRFLKKEQVAGLILDLRNNQGGSVMEAVSIIGYFLQGEPVMQARYRDGRQRILTDDDPATQFEGKVLVLVNEGSASASELTAATLQQYDRAIVVGGQTFGKGTIQRFFEVTDDYTGKKLGDVKLTIGSFYAGQGYATQYRGVMPDIILEDAHLAMPTGERNIKHALHIDHLPTYEATRDTFLLPALRRKFLAQKRRYDPKPIFDLLMKPELTIREKNHWQAQLSTDPKLSDCYLIMSTLLHDRT